MTDATEPAQPKKSRLKSGCLIAAGVVFGLAVLGSIIGDKKPGSNASPAVATSASPTVAPVEATARQIAAAYEENQIAAAKLYEGKALAVSGTVQKIDESMGSPVLNLATSNQFMPIRAKFPKDAADSLAAMHPGTKVVVVCEKLNEVGGFLGLEECKLQ